MTSAGLWCVVGKGEVNLALLLHPPNNVNSPVQLQPEGRVFLEYKFTCTGVDCCKVLLRCFSDRV